MEAFAKQVHGALEDGRSAAGGRLVRIRMPRVNGVTGAQSQSDAVVPPK
jgi:hypothetical protein